MQLQPSAGRYVCMNRRDPTPQSLHGPAWNGAGEWPFDIWLRRTLADAHNGALSEDLPSEWLALLEAAGSQKATR